MNYNKEMENIINNLNGKSKLLLHVCCAPCSSACIEKLSEAFSITCFFYNPNIDTEEEYNKRLEELKRFLFQIPLDIDIVEEGYNHKDFERIAEGREKDIEGGTRCYYCYKLRMEKTAKKAK